MLNPDSYYGAVGTKLEAQNDGSLLATASSPPTSTYTVTSKTKLNNITAFRLEAMTDPNLPHNGPGRATNGNFVLTHIAVDAISPDGKITNHIVLTNATADFAQPGYEITNALGCTGKKGWAVDGGPGRRNGDHHAVFETTEPVGFPEGTTLVFTMKQTEGTEHTLGRFRLSATTRAQRPIKADPLTRICGRPSICRRKSARRNRSARCLAIYRNVDSDCAKATRKSARSWTSGRRRTQRWC